LYFSQETAMCENSSLRKTGPVLRTLPVVFLFLAACGLLCSVGNHSATAQDEGGVEVIDEEALDEEALGEDVADSDGRTDPVEEDDVVPAAPPDSVLSWAFRSLGWSYSIVFLFLSFTLVALFVMNVITARRENVVPAQLVERFEQFLNDKHYQEAYDLAKNDESFLGRVLAAGLAKLSTVGYSQAIEAMQEVGEEENMKLDHQLSYMALIGTISPMIGLLGTVQGMVASFQVIATSTTAPSPPRLAEGISTALYTTLVGLFIAIPAIAVYNILRNRMARLVLEVGIVSEGLMSRFQNVGTRKQPQGPAPQTPPTRRNDG
jgi:biopolymer transport protein ExbB